MTSRFTEPKLDVALFSKLIRIKMVYKNETYKSLAKRIGVPRTTLYRVASQSQMPSAEVYLRIKEWLEQ